MAVEVSQRAAILGAGSWGTALSLHLGSIGHDVALWGRDENLMAEMASRRADPTYLPDVNLPPLVRPTADLADALRGAGYVVLAVPSHGLRTVLRAAAPHICPGAILVSATKGLEEHTLHRMSEVVTEETGARHPVVVLSGPSFAAEVAERLPTALVAASVNADAVRAVQLEFGGAQLRLYGSNDVAGVEIGGALKNVIAIAAGVVESLHLGHNALSALVTRGLAEISRVSCAMGGRRETLAGLSGLGDLVLTCTGSLSRNRHVGIELGRGRSLESILAGMRMVAEGVRTTTAALALGARHGVELPIAAQMADVLAGRVSPRDAVANLMLRPQRGERDGYLNRDMSSFFARIKAGLAKTALQIRERLGSAETVAPAGHGPVAIGRRTLEVDTFEALEDALLTADVGLPATERILAAVKADRDGSIRERVGRVIARIFSDVTPPPVCTTVPHVVLIVGVNGTGKTTTVGKLANLQRSLGRSVLVCAADTFRAAAVEQLAVWTERAGVDLIRAQSGSDPAAVTFDAVSAAKARGRDYVIVDTAGRLHTRANLMAELDKIRRVVRRVVPDAPHEVLLVLDATVGQNGLVQAREFMAASGANGIVLTKLDGTAKGGVAVAIAHELKLPIRYIGVGESIDDLVPFDADAYIQAIFTEKW